MSEIRIIRRLEAGATKGVVTFDWSAGPDTAVEEVLRHPDLPRVGQDFVGEAGVCLSVECERTGAACGIATAAFGSPNGVTCLPFGMTFVVFPVVPRSLIARLRELADGFESGAIELTDHFATDGKKDKESTFRIDYAKRGALEVQPQR